MCLQMHELTGLHSNPAGARKPILEARKLRLRDVMIYLSQYPDPRPVSIVQKSAIL